MLKIYNLIIKYLIIYRWTILVSLVVISYIVGLYGYLQASSQSNFSYSSIAYKTLQLYSLNFDDSIQSIPLLLNIARFFSPFVTISLTILTFMSFFGEKLGKLLVKYYKNHVIICGLGEKGVRIGKSFVENGYKVAVIESNPENQNLRIARDYDIRTIIGDASDEYYLEEANIYNAKYVFIVCGQDELNAKIANTLEGLDENKLLRYVFCYVHVVDQDLCGLLREKEITEFTTHRIRLEFFNIYEASTKKIIVNASPWRFFSTGNFNVILYGLNDLTKKLIFNILKASRNDFKRSMYKYNFVLVGSKVKDFLEQIRLEYPSTATYAEFASFETKTKNLNRSEFTKIMDALNYSDSISYVYYENDLESLKASLTINRLQMETGIEAPIITIVNKGNFNLSKLMSTGIDYAQEYNNIHVFSILEISCNIDLLSFGINEALSKMLHKIYLESISDSVNDANNESNRSWEDLPETLKESNYDQAGKFPERLAKMNYRVSPINNLESHEFEFNETEIEEMFRVEHMRWCKHKLEQGFVYGEEKSLRNKTHPCLVSWEKLPEHEKQKDKDMVRKLPSLLREVGYQIIPVITNANK